MVAVAVGEFISKQLEPLFFFGNSFKASILSIGVRFRASYQYFILVSKFLGHFLVGVDGFRT